MASASVGLSAHPQPRAAFWTLAPFQWAHGARATDVQPLASRTASWVASGSQDPSARQGELWQAPGWASLPRPARSLKEDVKGEGKANNGRLAHAAHATQDGDEWGRSLGRVRPSSRYPPRPGRHPRRHCALTLGALPLSRPSCDHRVPDGGAAGPGAVLREHAAPRGVLAEQEVPGVPSARAQACGLASSS